MKKSMKSFFAVASAFTLLLIGTVFGACGPEGPMKGVHTHRLARVSAVAAKCEETGTEEYFECVRCGKKFSDEAGTQQIKAPATVSPKGHTVAHVDARPASHEADGYAAHYECVVCNQYFEDEAGTHKIAKGGIIQSVHTPSRIVAEQINLNLAAGTKLAEGDIKVTAHCSECGRDYDVTPRSTISGDTLGEDSTGVTVTFDKFTVNLTVWSGPIYRLNLDGLTASDGNDFALLREGAPLPALTHDTDLTFLGYVDEDLGFYSDASDFEMPAAEEGFTVSAAYAEDALLWAPANRGQSGDEPYESSHFLREDGIVATRFNVENTEEGYWFRTHPGSDTGFTGLNMNFYLTTNKKRLLLLSVTNKGSVEVSLRQVVENYEVQGEANMTLRAGETKLVPLVMKGTRHANTCDVQFYFDEGLSSSVVIEEYGYVYFAPSDISALTVSEAPNKLIYKEGEQLDFTGLKLRCSIPWGDGQVFTMPVERFTNSKEGAVWHEDDHTAIFTYRGVSCEFLIEEKQVDLTAGMIHFKPSHAIANQENNPNSGAVNYISAQDVVLDDGYHATEFTLKAGTMAGTDVQCMTNSALNQNYNVGTPFVSGTPLHMVFRLTNKGDEEITAFFYIHNTPGQGVTMKVGAHETKLFEADLSNATTPGCWWSFRVDSNVTKDTSVVLDGFFLANQNVGSIQVNGRSTHKTTFKVGDTFSHTGLVITSPSNGYSYVVFENVTTNFDGHTFTAADVGTKTVTVTWLGINGPVTTTYTITVTA